MTLVPLAPLQDRAPSKITVVSCLKLGSHIKFTADSRGTYLDPETRGGVAIVEGHEAAVCGTHRHVVVFRRADWSDARLQLAGEKLVEGLRAKRFFEVVREATLNEGRLRFSAPWELRCIQHGCCISRGKKATRMRLASEQISESGLNSGYSKEPT